MLLLILYLVAAVVDNVALEPKVQFPGDDKGSTIITLYLHRFAFHNQEENDSKWFSAEMSNDRYVPHKLEISGTLADGFWNVQGLVDGEMVDEKNMQNPFYVNYEQEVTELPHFDVTVVFPGHAKFDQIVIFQDGYDVNPRWTFNRKDEEAIGNDGNVDTWPEFEIRFFTEEINPEDKIDLIFLGDGFDVNEKDKFFNFADDYARQLFEAEPFSTYKSFFNVKLIYVTSTTSGVSETNNAKPGTYFGSHFMCGGVSRALCTDSRKVKKFLAHAFDHAAHRYEEVTIIANSGKYGGVCMGRTLSTFSMGTTADVMIHELAHCMGELADEYDYGSCRENIFSDKTRNIDLRDGNKWDHWKDLEHIGMYEGGKYCERTYYRPCFQDAMRANGEPFYEVDLEQMILNILRMSKMIGTMSPKTKLIRGITHEEDIKEGDIFSINYLQTVDNTIHVDWYLNEKEITAETTKDKSSIVWPANTDFGILVVRVTDTTEHIRQDVENHRTERRTWVVNKPKLTPVECKNERGDQYCQDNVGYCTTDSDVHRNWIEKNCAKTCNVCETFCSADFGCPAPERCIDNLCKRPSDACQWELHAGTFSAGIANYDSTQYTFTKAKNMCYGNSKCVAITGSNNKFTVRKGLYLYFSKNGEDTWVKNCDRCHFDGDCTLGSICNKDGYCKAVDACENSPCIDNGKTRVICTSKLNSYDTNENGRICGCAKAFVYDPSTGCQEIDHVDGRCRSGPTGDMYHDRYYLENGLVSQDKDVCKQCCIDNVDCHAYTHDEYKGTCRLYGEPNEYYNHGYKILAQDPITYKVGPYEGEKCYILKKEDRDSNTITCGREGMDCCLDDRCHEGLGCFHGICKACGRLDVRCCLTKGKACKAGLQCGIYDNMPKCERCGKVNQQCCKKEPACEEHFECETSSNMCLSCGGNKEKCCDTTDPTCKAGFHCETGACQSCGGKNEQCCNADDKCREGFECDGSNVCKSCGDPYDACCQLGDACNGSKYECKEGVCQNPNPIVYEKKASTWCTRSIEVAGKNLEDAVQMCEKNSNCAGLYLRGCNPAYRYKLCSKQNWASNVRSSRIGSCLYVRSDKPRIISVTKSEFVAEAGCDCGNGNDIKCGGYLTGASIKKACKENDQCVAYSYNKGKPWCTKRKYSAGHKVANHQCFVKKILKIESDVEVSKSDVSFWIKPVLSLMVISNIILVIVVRNRCKERSGNMVPLMEEV